MLVVFIRNCCDGSTLSRRCSLVRSLAIPRATPTSISPLYHLRGEGAAHGGALEAPEDKTISLGTPSARRRQRKVQNLIRRNKRSRYQKIRSDPLSASIRPPASFSVSPCAEQCLRALRRSVPLTNLIPPYLETTSRHLQPPSSGILPPRDPWNHSFALYIHR